MLKLAAALLLVPIAFGTGWSAARTQDPAPEAGKETAEARKEKLVRKYLELTRSRECSERTMDVMLEGFEKMPMLPEGFAQRFKESFDLDQVIEFTVPVLMEHLDEETIVSAIAFYETELGKKLAEAQPTILVETARAGQAYGEKIGAQVAQELLGR